MGPDDPPIIEEKTTVDSLAPGYSVTDPDTIKQWIQSASELRKGGIDYREIQIPSVSSTMARVINHSGIPILIDIGANLEPQIKTYVAFDRVRPSKVKINEYIDVRVPGRIYLK